MVFRARVRPRSGQLRRERCTADVGVFLSDSDVGVTEDLLNDSQVHVLTDQQGACGVSSVVQSGVGEPSST